MIQVICPVCGAVLEPQGTAWRCVQGHCFDVARQGYVNLLTVTQKHSRHPGDTREMVAARRAFLDAGWYAPIAKTLADLVRLFCPEAASVLDALRFETEHLGVQTVLSCHIKKAWKMKNGMFTVESDQGTFKGDSLILAAGSKAAPVSGSDGSGYDLAKSFGHTIIKPLPALVQLKCKGTFFKQLAGVRCEAVVRLMSDGKTLAADEGEVQLTDYGISGIPTFQVSRYAACALDEGRQVSAVLDFFPSKSMEDTRSMLKQRKAALGYRPSGEFLNGVLNKKLAAVLLKQAGIPMNLTCDRLKDAQLDTLTMQLKKFEVPVTSTNSFEQAQVCCGGVDTRDIRPDTLESKLVKGLFLVGELTDVDGICGGYNLQWAWSTGAVAGRTAGRN